MDDRGIPQPSAAAPKLDRREVRLARDQLAKLRSIADGMRCRIERSVEMIEVSRALLTKLETDAIQTETPPATNGSAAPEQHR